MPNWLKKLRDKILGPDIPSEEEPRDPKKIHDAGVEAALRARIEKREH